MTDTPVLVSFRFHPTPTPLPPLRLYLLFLCVQGADQEYGIVALAALPAAPGAEMGVGKVLWNGLLAVAFAGAAAGELPPSVALHGAAAEAARGAAEAAAAAAFARGGAKALNAVGSHEGAGRPGETAGGAAAEAAGVWTGREARGGRIVTLRKCPLVAWASIANRQAAALPALAAALRPARLRRVGSLQLAADEVAPTALLAVRLPPRAKAKTAAEEAAEKTERAALVARGVAPPALPPPPPAQPVLLAATLGSPGRLIAWEAYAGVAPRLPGGSNDANGTSSARDGLEC